MTPDNWNIPDIVAAVIADDPEAAAIADTLAKSLQSIKEGRYTANPTAATRSKTGLSQNRFAAAIGISAHTLKSWEQGTRRPSGAAAALLKIIDRHPELIHELAQ